MAKGMSRSCTDLRAGPVANKLSRQDGSAVRTSGEGNFEKLYRLAGRTSAVNKLYDRLSGLGLVANELSRSYIGFAGKTNGGGFF